MSCQNISDPIAVVLRETFVTGHIQAVIVEAKLMQQCCIQKDSRQPVLRDVAHAGNRIEPRT